MALSVEQLSNPEAQTIIDAEEGQFSDVKSTDISPGGLSKAISAFANSDGGDLYIGVSETGQEKLRAWQGFFDQEAANGHLQTFERLFPLGTNFHYEFLKCNDLSGLVLHVHINKSQDVIKASNGLPYIRRGAQSLPVDSVDALRRLEYAKGISSFENEVTNAPTEAVTESKIITAFISQVVPKSTPDVWLKKQALIVNNKPVVVGVLLFSDEPQAHLPKRCGIKIYRYKTKDTEGFRDAMEFTPLTIEGCLYEQIKESEATAAEIIEKIPSMGERGLEAIKYPAETLHEIITNAIIHRDYSIADDVHIRIFDNRVEVESPGTLPAHITVENILEERFARNGAVVRLLNKFPDPPNQDIGEGLNTAFDAMHKLGLREPQIRAKENSVLVIIRHEPLASPEEAIMDYLDKNPTIKNKKAREITHITADYRIKSIFGRMVEAEMIEQVPNTRTSSTAYRKKVNNSDGL